MKAQAQPILHCIAKAWFWHYTEGKYLIDHRSGGHEVVGLTLPPCHTCHVLVHFYKGSFAVLGAPIQCFAGHERVGSIVGLMALDGCPASDMILLLGQENIKRSLQRRWHLGQE